MSPFNELLPHDRVITEAAISLSIVDHPYAVPIIKVALSYGESTVVQGCASKLQAPRCRMTGSCNHVFLFIYD
jgi:hypothetical protein